MKIASSGLAAPIILATILFFVLAVIVIVLILLYQKKQKQHTKQTTDLQHSYEQVLFKSQLEIQDETLRHIRLEIHDNIGQILSLAKLHLSTLHLAPTDEHSSAIHNSKQLVSKAIIDLRNLSKSIYQGNKNETGLEEKIKYKLIILEKTKKISAGLRIDGIVYPISTEIQTILFCIIQDVLNNIIQYLKADKIEVVIDYEPNRFCIFINENGIGYKLNEQAIIQFGNAIKKMQERGKIIGATISIIPHQKPGAGFNICLPKKRLIVG